MINKLRVFIILCFISGSLFGQEKEPRQMNRMWGDLKSKNYSKQSDNVKWFKDAKYAMFIHWGLFSEAANVWNGKTYYGIGEWLMKLSSANLANYEKLATKFNPHPI